MLTRARRAMTRGRIVLPRDRKPLPRKTRSISAPSRCPASPRRSENARLPPAGASHGCSYRTWYRDKGFFPGRHVLIPCRSTPGPRRCTPRTIAGHSSRVPRLCEPYVRGSGVARLTEPWHTTREKHNHSHLNPLETTASTRGPWPAPAPSRAPAGRQPRQRRAPGPCRSGLW